MSARDVIAQGSAFACVQIKLNKHDGNMSKNDDERLVDILTGEAVMALLAQDSPVFAEHVVAQLQAMAASERNPIRQRAFQRAIAGLLSATGQNGASSGSDDWQESEPTLH